MSSQHSDWNRSGFRHSATIHCDTSPSSYFYDDIHKASYIDAWVMALSVTTKSQRLPVVSKCEVRVMSAWEQELLMSYSTRS